MVGERFHSRANPCSHENIVYINDFEGMTKAQINTHIAPQLQEATPGSPTTAGPSTDARPTDCRAETLPVVALLVPMGLVVGFLARLASKYDGMITMIAGFMRGREELKRSVGRR